MKIELRHRWTNELKFTFESDSDNARRSKGDAIKKAISEKVDLHGTDLRDANLRGTKDDLFGLLCYVPGEAQGLLAALKEGRVNGSAYEGECACLVGTLANARHCHYMKIDGLRPNSSRPAERFFLAITTGDTPETSQPCALAAEWASEWIARMEAAHQPVTK
jgi:hypothetical protein